MVFLRSLERAPVWPRDGCSCDSTNIGPKLRLGCIGLLPVGRRQWRELCLFMTFSWEITEWNKTPDKLGTCPGHPCKTGGGFGRKKKVGKCEKEPPYHPPPRTWDIINWLPSNLSLHCPGASPATELMMMASKCPRGARKSVFEEGWGGPFSSTWNLLPRPSP